MDRNDFLSKCIDLQLRDVSKKRESKLAGSKLAGERYFFILLSARK
jgi:hypothetical protein